MTYPVAKSACCMAWKTYHVITVYFTEIYSSQVLVGSLAI